MSRTLHEGNTIICDTMPCMNILFVCRGNVGRSQFAEEICKQKYPEHTVLSAGTRVVSKEGESRHGQTLRELGPSAEHVITALLERGIQASENKRIQLNTDLVNWADIIITMAEPETEPEYLAQSVKKVYWEVKDPKGTSLDEHRNILEQISGRLDSFLK